MRFAEVKISAIDLRAKEQRASRGREDQALELSIRATGVQRPVILLENGRRFDLVKGGRRIAKCLEIGLATVPAMIFTVPAGEDVEKLRRRLRFVLDEMRQDLLPSQRAKLIAQVKRVYGLSNTEVARLIGVDFGSIANYLAPLNYIEEVNAALDLYAVSSGEKGISMNAARAVEGMSEAGQRAAWNAHAADLASKSGEMMQRRIRKLYGKTPGYWLTREEQGKRTTKPAKKSARVPQMSREKKDRLLNSLEVKEEELTALQDEQKRIERAILAAIPTVSAILRNEKLLARISEDQRMDLERFAEVYC